MSFQIIRRPAPGKEKEFEAAQAHLLIARENLARAKAAERVARDEVRAAEKEVDRACGIEPPTVVTQERRSGQERRHELRHP